MCIVSWHCPKDTPKLADRVSAGLDEGVDNKRESMPSAFLFHFVPRRA